jgi:hypothetical protein
MTEGGEPFRKCTSGWRNASQGTLQVRRIQTNEKRVRKRSRRPQSKEATGEEPKKTKVHERNGMDIYSVQGTGCMVQIPSVQLTALVNVDSMPSDAR